MSLWKKEQPRIVLADDAAAAPAPEPASFSGVRHMEKLAAVLAMHGVDVVLDEPAFLATPLHFRSTKNLSDQTDK